MPKTAPQIELTTAQADAISLWDTAKKALDANKQHELECRLEVIKLVPFKADKEEGGQTVKLQAGWKLALDKPMNYKIDHKDEAKFKEILIALHDVNPLGAETLIRWEPVMSVSVYKKLTDEEKRMISPIVTMTPGTPALELKPPSEVKA